MKWEPRASDIAWTENLLAVIKDGGSWAQPSSGATFVFYHSQKTYEVNDHMNFFPDMVARTRKVLTTMGWKERKKCPTP
jgi:hypothetical protein